MKSQKPLKLRKRRAQGRSSALLGAVLVLVLGVEGRAAEPARARPTFHREVVPILQKRCQSCHRPGEAAPMSLLTYDEARPWAESIREEVQARRMPPWHADPRHGRFVNDPTLSEEERKVLLAWAEGGAEEGDPREAPAPRSWPEGWSMGTPEQVFTMEREFNVPASGVVAYQYFLVPTGLTEDRWVQAAEVRPGNRAVVHHILVFVVPPGVKLGDRVRGGGGWDRFLAGTAPGEGPTVFVPGSGKRVPAGSSLLFQAHYTPNGKAAADRSSIGLIYAKERPGREVVTRAIANSSFKIPPGASEHRVQAEYTVSRDALLLSLMPHMHLRGKSFEYRAVFPDGREEVLLSVPRWDFNWQHSYRLSEPLPMPRGTRIRCAAAYDNSEANKHNPDPRVAVRWGDQTWEEMMIGFIDLSREPSPPRSPAPAARRERL